MTIIVISSYADVNKEQNERLSHICSMVNSVWDNKTLVLKISWDFELKNLQDLNDFLLLED